MPDKKNHPISIAEHWARALGVSKERLAAIVDEVVKERSRYRQQQLAAQPIE